MGQFVSAGRIRLNGYGRRNSCTSIVDSKRKRQEKIDFPELSEMRFFPVFKLLEIHARKPVLRTYL